MHGRRLQEAGVTNRWSDDLANYQVKTRELKPPEAFCNSIPCTLGRPQISSVGIRKVVPYHADYCPDCRSALYWRRDMRGCKW